jgi:hypothetical protein
MLVDGSNIPLLCDGCGKNRKRGVTPKMKKHHPHSIEQFPQTTNAENQRREDLTEDDPLCNRY